MLSISDWIRRNSQSGNKKEMQLLSGRDHFNAEILWNYHHLNQAVTPGDCLIVFGSHDERVAERGAELYLEGTAPFILFTGGYGQLTRRIWSITEAEHFAAIAKKRGVPSEDILLECNASHTGENIAFSRELLQKSGLPANHMIAVDKPSRERRTLAALQKQWQGPRFTITSPQYTWDEYLAFYAQSDRVGVNDLVALMVGDVQRIRIYGEQGVQIPQEIPEDVCRAARELAHAGYDRYLIR